MYKRILQTIKSAEKRINEFERIFFKKDLLKKIISIDQGNKKMIN
jgi:hypothetical protein